MPQPGSPSESSAELDAARARLEVLDPPMAAPPPPPPGAPAAEIGTTGAPQAELIDTLGEMAIDEDLPTLTEQDLTEVLEMLFLAVALFRGPHWELPTASAKRIAKWMRRSLDQNGALAAYIQKYFPPFITLALLSAEIRHRWEMDQAARPTVTITEAAP